MKQLYMYISLVLLLAGACVKVNNLADEAAVERFTVIAVQPADVRVGEVVIEPGKIRVRLSPRDDLFPFTFRTETKVSHTTVDLVNIPAEFRFETGSGSERFYAVAESGIPHAYDVTLEAIDTGADITTFSIQGEAGSITIDPWAGAVHIPATPATFPYKLTATLALSNGSAVQDTLITFENINQVKEFAVITDDGAYTRTWKISLESPAQLPNADFELWINEGTTTVNIDPMPGKVWGTGNNSFVQGTLPVNRNGGRAAEMTTGIQKIPFLNHELVTAGTLYTGNFVLSLSFENPRSMTNFGVSHKRRIAAVAFDAYYVAGVQLQQSVKNGSKYVVTDIEGRDTGEAWVEVLNWAGSGELKYHGDPVDGVTVLGRGNIIFDGTEASAGAWSNFEIPVAYTNTILAPTHLVIVFTSSKDGDKFIGAKGSKLTVDNVTLRY
ncbi:MAG: PCMD domain-containing protein [Odoribacteraceae bacterium]|jgi:hypothetical protein|nr:PCMD domain-containing protein [Odoribacteraceae bacterium]